MSTTTKNKFSTYLLVLTALFATLTYVAGLIRLPIGPVPFTLQTAVVIMAGILLPPTAAFLSQLIHFFLQFILGGGIALFLSPTFGFILGFMVMAFVISLAVRRLSKATFLNLLVIAIIGEVILYLIGLPYMAYILLQVKGLDMGLMAILNAGIIPFILPDLAKAVLAIVIALRIKPRVNL